MEKVNLLLNLFGLEITHLISAHIPLTWTCNLKHPQWKVGGGVGKYDSYLGKPGNLIKCILNKLRYLCVTPMHIKIPQTCYWSIWEVQLQLLFRHQLLQAMSSCEYRLGSQSGFVLKHPILLSHSLSWVSNLQKNLKIGKIISVKHNELNDSFVSFPFWNPIKWV